MYFEVVIYLVPIDVDRVVVEPRVPDEPLPLVPAGGNVVAVVLVQVLAEVACKEERRGVERREF